MMELKIYNPQEAGFIQRIDWNFAELKQEIAAAAQEYEATVYTDDLIKTAKADRARLNKFVEALTKKRTEIRKKLLAPDEQFGAEVMELTGIVQKAIANIDTQVKDYERRQREAKTAKIRDFYDANIGDLESYLPFDRIMKPEYANAGTTMKSVQAEIMGMIQRVAEGLAILNEVDSPYAGDMKKVFLQTYDISAAMARRNQLEAEAENRRLYTEEQERRKAEREAARKAESERVMAAGRAHDPSRPSHGEPQPAGNRPGTPEEAAAEPVYVIDFRVHATAGQLEQLKNFLKVSGIRFEPVPKN